MRDANPYYYAYRATWTGGRQTGLACIASLADYATGRIRKHELTTPVKETDRVKQIEALNAQTGPVMMAYPHAPELDRALKRATERDPDVAVTADDDVTHELWVIGDAAAIDEFTAPVRGAARALHRRRPPPHRGGRPRGARRAAAAEGSHGYFLSVIFPHHEMTILDYNRVVRDLNGRTPEQLLAEIGARFAVTPPLRRCGRRAAPEFGMFLGGRWYRLKLRPELVPRGGPDRAAADHAAQPQPDRADPRHRRPAHRQAHRLRRRRARPGRARAPRQLGRDGGGLRALSHQHGRPDGGGGRGRASCRRSPPGSSPSSPTAW